ncbi:MAG: DUF3179 domain-containing protein [Haloglomus sp.]
MDVRQIVPRDAIPSVDDPRFRDGYDGEESDEAIVVERGRGVRAYPLRYLHYHEIVNDRIDELPVAVTWCPLCGSAVVYDRRVDGRTLEFGVSGKLADDDLVMYDRETGSEWKQSSGEAIAGDLRGAELSVLPASVTSIGQFRAAHPDGQVLAPPGGQSEAASEDDTPGSIDYDESPYERYFEMDGFGLAARRGGEPGREWDREDLAPKTVVLGIERGGDALGFPLPRVEAAGGLVRATVGDGDVLVVVADGIHAYEAPTFELQPIGEGALRGDGTRWDGTTGRSDDGRRLSRVPARRLFAFTWQDDNGPDAFFARE